MAATASPSIETATGQDDTAPDWFRWALDQAGEHHFVEVDGCAVHYLLWRNPGKPGLLLVHGNSGSAYWWSFLAPFLARDYQVAAVCLSGMGDSGWRQQYSLEAYADEFLAVAADAALGPQPVIVGHSFGALLTLYAAHLHAEKLGGIVLVDFAVRPVEKFAAWINARTRPHPSKIYPDRETALARFRLEPPQPCANQFLFDHIARHSLTQADGGWRWKFDPFLFSEFDRVRDYAAIYPAIACPVGVIRGMLSERFTDDELEFMRALTDDRVPVIEIPEAHHHIMLDQPIALVTAIRGILQGWK